jgi:hypothetical protein
LIADSILRILHIIQVDLKNVKESLNKQSVETISSLQEIQKTVIDIDSKLKTRNQSVLDPAFEGHTKIDTIEKLVETKEKLVNDLPYRNSMV